jgi:hypothetical protein
MVSICIFKILLQIIIIKCINLEDNFFAKFSGVILHQYLQCDSATVLRCSPIIFLIMWLPFAPVFESLFHKKQNTSPSVLNLRFECMETWSKRCIQYVILINYGEIAEFLKPNFYGNICYLQYKGYNKKHKHLNATWRSFWKYLNISYPYVY